MQDIVLSIEAGVAGGSLALHQNGQLLVSRANPESKSRSEGLLNEIDVVLERTSVKKASITRIAVSIGPGSYTGIRIGIAAALGLASALGIPCRGISLFKAIAFQHRDKRHILVAVPIGRNGLCWREFEGTNDPDSVGDMRIGDAGQLQHVLNGAASRTILLHGEIFPSFAGLTSGIDPTIKLNDIGRELAVAIGLASEFTDDGLNPIYARETSFPTLTGEKVTR